MRENTIIVFTSDNGYNGGVSSNDLMRGSKGEIYEGGVRVPAFINWPGKVPARRTEIATSVLDYFPTFLDVAGIRNYKGQLDGNSLTPLFKRDTKKLADRPIFWHLASQYRQGTCSALRHDRYKLIQFLADGKVELYDLKADPLESKNLVESQPKIAKRLLNELVTWRKINAVPLPPNSVVKL